MSILGDIERLINEHGSAGILRERLALAKDEHAALEKKVATLAKENADLRRQNQSLELDNQELNEQIGNLKKQLSDVQGEALDKDSESIIALLATKPGLPLKAIAATLGMHPTKAEHFLNGLYRNEYVGISGDYVSGVRTYRLYPKGQEYAVKRGFV